MPRRRALPRLLPRKQPAQARARRTYRAIVVAAARILERDGYEALTTNHVARLAGVGIASLYEYFPNKQSLVAEVVRDVLEDILADLHAGAGSVTAQPLEDFLSAWIAAMFAAVQKRRGVVLVLLREVPFLWQIPAVEQARARLLELALVSNQVRSAALRLPPLSEATLYVLTTMTGAAVLEAVLRPPPRMPQAALVEAVAGIVTRVAYGAAPRR